MLKIIFAGNIGYAQGLDIIPKVAKILKEKQQKVSFYILGDGRYKKELVKQISKNQVEDVVRLLERCPVQDVPKYMSCCDVAYISFMDNSLFSSTIPAKLQTYMTCRMPILAVAKGETKRIVAEAKCGWCSEVGNADALAETIEKIIKIDKKQLKEIGERGLKYCQEYFNKHQLMEQIDTYFK